LFQLAAEQGHADAQYSLGIMYHEGQGMSQNYAEAAKWLRLAAEQGYVVAESDLAVMYEMGQGVAQNYHQRK
jgi:TPR repeat protein